MRDIYKETLVKNRENLKDQVMFRHVAPQLCKAGVLSEEEWRRVASNSQHRSDEEQMDSLVDILLTKGDEAFDVLLTALAPNYWWLVAQLQSTYNAYSNSQRNHIQNNINFCANRQTAIQKSANTKITPDMVKEMRRNPRLIRNWCSLANRLGLGSESVNVQTRVNKECMDQDYCVALLLEAWQNKCPSQATLENLIRHLRAEDFNDVADNLESHYLSC